jgi:hypothetical protein
MDDDVTGADIGLDTVNLSPSSGLDPSRLVRSVPTAATGGTFPQTAFALLQPVSTTQDVTGSTVAPIAPAPGQPVNLAPPNPANLVINPQRGQPVISQGSIAPMVQTAQTTSPQAQGQPNIGSVSPYQTQPAPSGVRPIPGTGTGPFGSNQTMYPAVDPNMNPLETARGILKGEADRALNAANNPMRKFWFGESTKKDAAEAAQKYQQIDQIDKQLQEQKNNQMKADNSGIPRNQQTWTQTNDTVVENLVNRMRGGDQTAMDALVARGQKDLVAAYQPDMVAAMESQHKQGLQIKDRLDSATTDKEYNEIRNELTDPQHPLSGIGFNIPRSLGEWQAQRAQRDEAGRRAGIAISRYQQQRAQYTDFTDQTDKDMSKTQTENMRMSNGEVMPGTTAKVHLGYGVNGVADVYGSNDLRLFGADKGKEGTWGNYGPKERETIGKELETAYPKTEREKTVSFLRTYKMATTGSDGKPLIGADQKLINTNPNVQQAIAEGFAAAMRGGAGGANGQLMKIELAKRGPVQEGLDKLIGAYAGGKGVITGEMSPYLSKLTQGQIRYVLDFLKDYNIKDISTRLNGVAEHIGSYGGRLDQSGLEPELQDTLKGAHAYGRDTEKLYRSQLPAIVRDHDRIYLDRGVAGRSVPGASVNPIPLSALPGLTPELANPPPSAAPVAPSGGSVPPPPASPPATPPAGGGGVRAGTPLPYNPRAGQYGGVAPAAPVTAAPAAPVVPAGGAFPATGAAPVPFTPAPAMAAPGPLPGPRSSLSDTIGNVASNVLGISSAQAAERPPAPWDVVKRPASAVVTAPGARAQPSGPLNVLQQATAAAPAPTVVAPAALPSSWGAGVGNVPAPAPVPPSVPTPQQPGGPGTGIVQPPPPVAAPQGVRPGGTFSQGVPSNGFPAHVAAHPNARTVFGVAGQTAQNVSNNPVIANNSAIVATSSAHSESNFQPDTLHDKDKNGNYIGYGLFGHNDNGGRLSAMQQFAGVPVTGKPDQKIPVNVQTSFFVREMSKAADSDPFIAKVLSDPNASAEDLTRVQIRMERPQGYKGPGTEEQANRWAQRLANTKAAMSGDGAGSTSLAVSQPAVMPYPNPTTREQALANYQAGVRQTTQETATRQQVMNERAAQATRSAAHLAPALGGAAGGVIGSALPGVGTVAGGAIGGTIGGGIENYFTGTPEQQTPRGYAEAAGWGGVRGAVTNVPGMGPVATAARVAGSTAIPAAKQWYEGGDAGQIFDAGMKGMAEGVFGEAFGRGLGLGHQVWNSLSTSGKSELLAAGKILATQEAKIAGPGGKMIDNPVWQQAEASVKKLHQDPDTVAYNYKQTEATIAAGGIPKTTGEVLTQRPGAVAEAKIGREQYDPIRQQIAEAPKPSAANAPQFKHDPEAIVGSAAVPERFRADAVTAKKIMTTGNGPVPVVPKTWKEVWNNQIDARASLLDKERKAEAAPSYANQKEDMKAYRAMADKVRDQQQHIAESLLPPDRAKAVMQNLDEADKAYREAKIAGGKDIVKTIAQGGDDGREALAAFNKLMGKTPDPAAQRMMNALVALHNKTGERLKTGGWAAASYAIAHIPGVGPIAAGTIGAVRGLHLLQQHMLERAAGKTATFADLIKREVSAKTRQRYVNASSSLAGPAVTQGVNMLQSDEAAP